MAVVSYIESRINRFGENAKVITWTALLNGDSGQPVEMPTFADRSIQVSNATFGAGGNLRWEGSNDGNQYQPLNDPQGNVLNITAGKIEQVLEVARFMRPIVTAGDGTTTLNVSLLIVSKP